MKILICIIPLILLTGCVTNVNYDLSAHETNAPLEIKVQDKRESPAIKTTYKYATFTVGDSNVNPHPTSLVAKKLNKYLSKEAKESIKEISLLEFNLIISDPQHAALLGGAAMAGGSYAAGILVESGLSANAGEDGVISKVKLRINESDFSCVKFVPAYKEIGALVGPMVSGKEITAPMNEAIDGCIKYISSNYSEKKL